MGGSRAIRELSVVCARRRRRKPTATPAKGESLSPSSSSTSPPALQVGRRLVEEGGGRSSSGTVGGGENGNKGGGGLRGVAGLAAYRTFLGEIAIGPWRQETPSTFGNIEGLRAEEMACFFSHNRSGDSSGVGADSDGAVVLVDLSLPWESEGCVGRGKGMGNRGAATTSSSSKGGVFGPGSPWATLHCDLWRASEEEEGGWRWLGRAYGQKYRLTGLRIDCGGKSEGVEEAARATVLAVQQVNAMGYREVSTLRGSVDERLGSVSE